ncbi:MULTISPECIES: MarR family transcriptional regulator [unclassified Thioalkalivibrio]|uniref:MarR family transcriptional regulator n=1 Tax=unclassified Thioalkalivibrio TaxID=2621013 RepID=UPI00036E9DD4|nr:MULTISPECIES: MarR family transcriptional regulator [unclassified Thioalkalivibrio]
MRIETPASRPTDPGTSAVAEREITASGKRHQQMLATVDLLRCHPGLTSSELSRTRTAESMGLDRYMIARRLPDAETAGLVERGPSRRDVMTHRTGVTWWPKEVE